MAEQIDDGGSAFPLAATEHTVDHHGMSLRDWFAGQALAGIGVWIPPADYGPFDWADRTEVTALKARWAYAQADAMLAVRAALSQAEGGQHE
ncbi:hypothetical protein OSH11_11925 [Kaistia dalseonensis]|uniref:Uncharacterized protein n=1 Tax=Kaistia dalseonensis TaxID=410840 RepID=A0ABU0H6R3_9HYPH|nr:hypothetical protein [Kaistia dalseonensis]MCX5495417.1 hypothetical protein [Kaistia dalseonensis]MDQ0438007.1 hypothetical protein [Kaistia dalseonensis]